MIALRKSTQATACAAKMRSRLITNWKVRSSAPFAKVCNQRGHCIGRTSVRDSDQMRMHMRQSTVRRPEAEHPSHSPQASTLASLGQTTTSQSNYRPPPPAPMQEALRHTQGECLPGACPARYLCIKYLISSPKGLSPLREVPQVDRTRPQTFSANLLFPFWTVPHPCLFLSPTSPNNLEYLLTVSQNWAHPLHPIYDNGTGGGWKWWE